MASAAAGMLAAEATTLMRYLAGVTPTGELVERYVDANETLLVDECAPSDRVVLAFALDHRWALPLLDGATGLAGSDAWLRQKLFVAAAVLEASTHHVDVFMPGYTPPLVMVGQVGFWGVKAAIKGVLGLPLLLTLRWRAR